MQDSQYQMDTNMLSPTHALMYILGTVILLAVCTFLYAQLFYSLMV